MIEIIVTKQKIKILSSDIIVSGTAWIKAHFSFSEDWDGLAKTAVFRVDDNGCRCHSSEDGDYPVLIDDDGYCNIPVSILKPESKLKIGVYGVDSDRTYPTIWSSGLIILEGAIPDGTVPPEDESVYHQILEKMVRIEEEVGDLGDLMTEDKTSIVNAVNEVFIKTGIVKPYVSLERVCSYLYKVTYSNLADLIVSDSIIPAGCSSFLQNGKMYRNLDWDYSELASFHVVCPGFEGMAFSPGLTDQDLNDDLLGQLPYRIVDGCNDHGIRVSTHVLFNDWNWVGHGLTPLYMMPYLILNGVHSLENFSGQIGDILGDLYATSTLTQSDYLLHFFVTDGTTAYAIEPPETPYGQYQVIDISSNPKLSNFRWVNSSTVTRQQLQRRPTGVERWNLMPCSLEDLRFTKAYESPARLSEFIGLRGTTKDSSDSELMAIYNDAHDLYMRRTRDGSTWQTMHSVIYGANGLESLYVQENWEKNVAGGSCSGGEPSYIFDQQTASDRWSIEHNLSKYPSVTVVDSANSVVVGDIEYTSMNSLVITFNGAFSGKAYLN